MNTLILGSILLVCSPNGLGLGGKVERRDDAPPPPAPVTCLTLAPDTPHAFSGRFDGRVFLHDTEMGTERELAQLEGAIEGVAVAAGGVVVAVDDRGTLVRVSLSGQASPLGRHEPGALDVALSPDGEVAATAGSDGEIRLWSLAKGEETDRLEGHEGPVAALAWGPERLWSAGWDRTVRGWKVSASGRGKKRGSWPAGERELSAIAAHPSADRALSASWTGLLRLWKGKGRKADQALRPARPFMEAINSLAFDRSGERAVAVASAEKTLRVFATDDHQTAATVITQLREPSCAVFFPDQDALLVGFYDGRVIRVPLPGKGAK